jgi:Bromodomain
VSISLFVEGQVTPATRSKSRAKGLTCIEPSLRSKESERVFCFRPSSINRALVLTLMFVPFSDRHICADFMRLPSKKEYPDYYEMIKKPISFAEVKVQSRPSSGLSVGLGRESHILMSPRIFAGNTQAKLDAGAYPSLALVREDMGQIFVNAKRFNVRESSIFAAAKKLHVRRLPSPHTQ